MADEYTNTILLEVKLQCGNASDTTWWPTLEPTQVMSPDYLQTMHVAPSGGQIYQQCKWHHLVVEVTSNASSAICWPNLQRAVEINQDMESIPGSVVPLFDYSQLFTPLSSECFKLFQKIPFSSLFCNMQALHAGLQVVPWYNCTHASPNFSFPTWWEKDNTAFNPYIWRKRFWKRDALLGRFDHMQDE